MSKKLGPFDEYTQDWSKEERINFIKKLYPSLNPSDFPSILDEDFLKMHEFAMRDTYIMNLGYALFNWEFFESIDSFFKFYNIKNFIEVDAGFGTFSTALCYLGYEGIGYTLAYDEKDIDIEDEDDYDPLKDVLDNMDEETKEFCINAVEELNKRLEDIAIFRVIEEIKHAKPKKIESIYDKEIESMGCLKYQNIRTVQLQQSPDVVIASWIPLGRGDEVIEFFENQWRNGIETPWFMLIGEGWGGATASDEFFDWLEENFVEVDYNRHYIPFAGMRDHCNYWRRKDDRSNKGKR